MVAQQFPKPRNFDPKVLNKYDADIYTSKYIYYTIYIFIYIPMGISMTTPFQYTLSHREHILHVGEVRTSCTLYIRTNFYYINSCLRQVHVQLVPRQSELQSNLNLVVASHFLQANKYRGRHVVPVFTVSMNSSRFVSPWLLFIPLRVFDRFCGLAFAQRHLKIRGLAVPSRSS